MALKVLPEAFAQDEQRMARFSREAQVLASLNHPNIASIHGLEHADGKQTLVLELVEGEDLTERITRGAIPLEESLKTALQIAEALEAAHEKRTSHLPQVKQHEMSYLATFGKGRQNEHLGLFILSRFVFVANPVTVSDDLGSDLFCNLFTVKRRRTVQYLEEMLNNEPTLGLVAEGVIELQVKGETSQRIVAGGSFLLPDADSPATIVNDPSEVPAKVITFRLK